jgi:hypothetical protein
VGVTEFEGVVVLDGVIDGVAVFEGVILDVTELEGVIEIEGVTVS